MEAVACNRLTYNLRPLQLGMGRSPWRVAVASILLHRARYGQASRVLEAVLIRWSTPAELGRADSGELEQVLRPCGFQKNRARQLARMSMAYIGDAWNDLRDLPGVGAYTSDAVGLFCFERTALESNDGALREYAHGKAAAR